MHVLFSGVLLCMFESDEQSVLDSIYTAKLNSCFDLAVVILVAVLSDTKEDKSLFSLVILRKIRKLRKIKPCHYNLRQFPV